MTIADKRFNLAWATAWIGGFALIGMGCFMLVNGRFSVMRKGLSEKSRISPLFPYPCLRALAAVFSKNC
jgi:hypothetical protein